MRVACPHCRASNDLSVLGPTTCGHCKRPFRYLRLRHAALPALVAAPAVENAAICVQHSGNAAAGNCERCGDFICSLCQTPSEGRTYCVPCFESLMQRGALKFTQTAFLAPDEAVRYGSIGLALSLCGPGFVLGLMAIFTGVRALKRIAASPDLPGKNKAITGIVLGALALTVPVLAILALVAWRLL